MTSTMAITLGISLLGAVLGIINTWRSFDRDRIRLVVVPKWAVHSSGWDGGVVSQLCVEVTNLSFIPITVNQIAFGLGGPQKKNMFFFFPEMIDGGTIPRRLEPRSSFTVYMKEGLENHPSMKYVRYAFAKTACGLVFKGTSPALRGHVKKQRLSAKDTSQ